MSLHEVELKAKVSRVTDDYMQLAETVFSIRLPAPEICFDLRGTTAGQAIVQGAAMTLRYNSLLLVEHADQYILQTVPHEVAHLVVYHRHGARVRPHGNEWKQVMRVFGADESRCHRFDTSNIKTRELKRFAYRCACRQHHLTSIRHNRVLAGNVYRCRVCEAPLEVCHESLRNSSCRPI